MLCPIYCDYLVTVSCVYIQVFSGVDPGVSSLAPLKMCWRGQSMF